MSRYAWSATVLFNFKTVSDSLTVTLKTVSPDVILKKHYPVGGVRSWMRHFEHKYIVLLNNYKNINVKNSCLRFCIVESSTSDTTLTSLKNAMSKYIEYNRYSVDRTLLLYIVTLILPSVSLQAKLNHESLEENLLEEKFDTFFFVCFLKQNISFFNIFLNIIILIKLFLKQQI